jgi:hypothetical protein
MSKSFEVCVCWIEIDGETLVLVGRWASLGRIGGFAFG